MEFSVAPMMDWTDRHCRYFHRLISPSIRLYTEMVSTGAILHGDAPRFLRFSAQEQPVALQLGGNDPDDLARCTSIAVDHYGYGEVNLNCGCPSDKVQSGAFGASLMVKPDLVADCMDAMRAAAPDALVSVKCRIGIDDFDSYDFLFDFIKIVSEKGGVQKFVVHARKAILGGLSPKQNREIPPLRYDFVQQIKKDFPDLTIILNGGLRNLNDIDTYSIGLDGIMIGREAYQNPWFLRGLEKKFNPKPKAPLLDEEEIVLKMAEYASEQEKAYGTPVKSIARHMTGLFHGCAGAKAWRQTLSTLPHEEGAGAEIFEKALQCLR